MTSDRPQPAGSTLVELLITLTILAAILAATLGVLDQQRIVLGRAASSADARAQLRQAIGPLAAELRALAPASGDIVAMTDSGLEIAATMGTAITCDSSTDGRTLLVANRGSAAAALTTWADAPEPGDDVRAWRAPDTWRRATIASVAADPAACGAATTFAAAASAPGALRVTLATPLPLPAGTPLRFVRLVRWSRYLASDGRWYLGYDDRRAGRWSGVQPVAGPFADRTAAGATFSYFDRTGTATPDSSRVARIDILLATPSPQSRPGPRAPLDSALMRVAIRNAP